MDSGRQFLRVQLSQWYHGLESSRASLFVPCASRAEPAPAKKLRVSEPLSWHHIVRSGAEQTWKDKREADFQVALRRWHDVLILLPCSIIVFNSFCI